MKKAIITVLKVIEFFFAVYVITPVIWLISLFLRYMWKRVRVNGLQNRKKAFLMAKNEGRGIVLVMNHLSFWVEPFLAPAIFFCPRLFFPPFKHYPWSTPDKKNFTKWWLFFMQGMRLIHIPRNENGTISSVLKTLGTIVCVKCQHLSIFPEGGRTVTRSKGRLIEKDGFVMGKFSKGLLLAIEEGMKNEGAKVPIIVPALIEGTDNILPYGQKFPDFSKGKMTMTIGKPFVPDMESVSIKMIQDAVFDLRTAHLNKIAA